jgi:phage head maturation protease
MKNGNKIILEASGEFPFEFFIERAIPREGAEYIQKHADGSETTEKEMILEGVASTTNVDHDHERMSKEALASMEAAINNGGVPLRVEHSKEPEAIIGRVFKGWVDDRNQLHIQAKLDPGHAVSSILYNAMKTGSKMGLSVGGLVKRAVREFVESKGETIKTFYDVDLKEVSVTPRPANYDSWLVAKSIAKNKEDAQRFWELPVNSDFLFENPHLDYLQVFAKSVPDKAWRKSENTSMENKDEKKDETTETGKATVSRSEFNALKSLIAEGFNAVKKAMETPAKDQVGPDAKKDDPEVAAKAEGDAKDGTNPDAKKDDPEVAAKAEAGRDGQEDSEGNGSDNKGEREKSEKKDTDDTYELNNITRAIKSINDLTLKMSETDETDMKEKAEDKTDETDTATKAEDDKKDDETATKAEETDEKKDETTKGIHPVDQLAIAVSKALEVMATKMEKAGVSNRGFEKSIINTLRNDQAFQDEIAKMMKVPGAKKSVVRGTPFVTTKDGRSYSLSMTEQGTNLAKSRDSKDFKSEWKSNYSPVSTQTDG